jgi:hypothetical protein
VRCAIWQQDFAHDERGIGLGGIWEDGYRLEQAVRAMSLGLACGTAVKAPQWELFELWEGVEFLDLSFSAKVWDRLVAIEPDIFEFVLGDRLLVGVGVARSAPILTAGEVWLRAVKPDFARSAR